MKYKGSIGAFDNLFITRDTIVVRRGKKPKMEQGLGFIVQKLNPNKHVSSESASIYFDLRKAKFIHKRIGKLIKEIEEKKCLKN